MLEITVTVQAPELAGAMLSLAAAMSGAALPTSAPARAQLPSAAPAKPATPAPAPIQAPAAPVPTATPAAAPAPVQRPAAPPVVPVAPAPTYNRDQIMTAGAALIDAGKINELMGLLNAFGVQAVTQLKQEQLGAFATELRKLGAQI